MAPAAAAGFSPQAGDADSPHEHVRRARLLRAAGRVRDALSELEAAARLKPDDVAILLEQGELYLALEEVTDAHDCYQLALAHAPDQPVALLGLARTLRAAGSLDAAEECIERAARVAPTAPEIWLEAAAIHGRRDEAAEAVVAYRRALQLAPGDAAAWTNLGLIYLSRLGAARDAQHCLERALSLAPASVEAQANLGLALEEQGRVNEALAHYDKLISAQPEVSEFRWNRGLALLSAGDYARGWDDYETRNSLGRGAPPRKFPFPLWQGEALQKGDSLLIFGEQGIGDEVMFASCIPDLPARKIECVIECDKRLAGLFARSFPAARVHGAPRDGDRQWLGAYPSIRMQIPIGSLPRLLRRSRADFPQRAGYLAADPQRIAAWNTRLKAKPGTRAVGVAWRGGTRGTRAELRSLELATLEPLLRMPATVFVNLQRGGSNEFQACARRSGAAVFDFGDAIEDLEELAALCAALDRVVTVDNSLAHLAGALGRPTHVLLPFSGDWRWVRGERTSPWYPSVTLYRQAVAGEWALPVRELCARFNAD